MAQDNPRHAHFDIEELRACVAEARTGGLEVMAHAQATDGIKNAVRAGIRSIEHGIYLDGELGTIEPGKRADLVLVDGDPFDFGGLAGAVREVWKDGARVRPRHRHLASA